MKLTNLENFTMKFGSKDFFELKRKSIQISLNSNEIFVKLEKNYREWIQDFFEKRITSFKNFTVNIVKRL